MAVLMACVPGVAQTAPPSVLVTGNPLNRADLLRPATALSGDALDARRAGSLGDTLDGLPGVAQSGFAPGSSRPVIRGLDGDRIRLLEGGAASLDASSLSFDHGTAVDPLVVERVEVLRGPAALLYGGNAVGGVVNLLDNRIPKAPQAGLAGRAEVRLGGAASERAAAAVLEGGTAAAGPQASSRPGLVWHVDLSARRASHLAVPSFNPPGADAPMRRVANSQADSDSGAVGASWVGRDGHLGASVDQYRSTYGVVVDPDVTIRMRRERVQLSGEQRRLGGPFEQVEFHVQQSRYGHEELEAGGEVGTTFRNRGHSARLQLRHVPVGALTGVLGLQTEQSRFSALGEEAFVPTTHSRQQSLFLLESWQQGAWTVTGGCRAERITVRSEGDAPDAEESRFGDATSRRFSPSSALLAVDWKLSPDWTAGASMGRTGRAPAYYELFANGLHVATRAFEVGDPNLATERSRHAELSLRWKRGAQQVQAHLWQTRFANHIALLATGRSVAVEAHHGEPGEVEPSDEPPETVPEYAFTAVPARFTGAEIETQWRLAGEGGWLPALRLAGRPADVDAGLTLDTVRAVALDSGEPLPRIAPARLTARLQAGAAAWRVEALWRLSAAQTRVPAGERATRGHGRLDLRFQWRPASGAFGLSGVPGVSGSTGAGLSSSWTLTVTNLTNQLAYHATTLESARAYAPLPGRGVSLVWRAGF